MPKDASMLIVDDVLATGKSLCAVISLLVKAGVEREKIQVNSFGEVPDAPWSENAF